MKKLMLLFAIAIGTNGFSQSIENTVWKTYSSLYSDTLELTFGTDSMHQRGSNLGPLVNSIYTMTGGDTVSFWDIGGNSAIGCAEVDTGVYRGIGFTTDTMTLMLLNDDCSNRGVSYDGVVFWNTFRPSPPTGLSNTAGEENRISLYPNPSNGVFNIEIEVKSQIQVYSITGELILASQTMEKGINKIELPQSTHDGIYFVRFTSNKGSVNQRIVINRD